MGIDYRSFGRQLKDSLIYSIYMGAFYPYARGNGRFWATKNYFEKKYYEMFPNTALVFEDFISYEERCFIETYTPKQVLTQKE